jgi:hypothetical protein
MAPVSSSAVVVVNPATRGFCLYADSKSIGDHKERIQGRFYGYSAMTPRGYEWQREADRPSAVKGICNSSMPNSKI